MKFGYSDGRFADSATPKNIYEFKDKIFALGSCQTNGWQSQLRLIAEIFNKLRINNLIEM